MFQIQNLSVSVEDKEIIKDFSLEIKPGELHVLMGPNGSGKSSLSLSLSGHPKYSLSLSDQFKSKIILDRQNITKAKPEERARAGLFMAFQSPVAVPGVKITSFLRLAYNSQASLRGGTTKQSVDHKRHGSPLRQLADRNDKKAELGPLEFYQLLKKKAKLLNIPDDFLGRNLNDQFSGGEKKKMEMLQALVLQPKYAILDEPDTGTDVDALKIIAKAIGILQKQGTGILLITHYQRLLKFLKPDRVHVLKDGKLVASGSKELVKKIEKSGYEKI